MKSKKSLLTYTTLTMLGGLKPMSLIGRGRLGLAVFVSVVVD